jgi:hypothetical protein
MRDLGRCHRAAFNRSELHTFLSMSLGRALTFSRYYTFIATRPHLNYCDTKAIFEPFFLSFLHMAARGFALRGILIIHDCTTNEAQDHSLGANVKL